jgi:transglutaminase-like putative cysteine protease
LLQWVYSHIEKRPVLSVPSALETLKTGVGDCNEHATLLAALLRAVGIPARLNIGLVYSREKFYYHAWTEAYLGDWISMDAALNQMPVDATHVKFIEGNLEKQIEMVRVIEKLELKVIAFEHD